MKKEAVLEIEWARPAYEKGIKDGLQRGIEKGIEKGKQEGKLEEKIQIAKSMIAKSFPIKDIMDLTGLSEKQLKENRIIKN